ncbi:hypothetical protein AKJ16_DCAP16243 [Drosera capensis]
MQVLAPGGAKNPTESLLDFLGREPSIQAFVDNIVSSNSSRGEVEKILLSKTTKSASACFLLQGATCSLYEVAGEDHTQIVISAGGEFAIGSWNGGYWLVICCLSCILRLWVRRGIDLGIAFCGIELLGVIYGPLGCRFVMGL